MPIKKDSMRRKSFLIFVAFIVSKLVACIISYIQYLDEKKEETATRPSPNNMADPDTYQTPFLTKF
jgi:hypothetical protein